MSNNYKDFSLEVALKEPHRVVTRGGKKIKDLRGTGRFGAKYCLEGSIVHDNTEVGECWRKDGKYYDPTWTHPFDLFLLPKEEELIK